MTLWAIILLQATASTPAPAGFDLAALQSNDARQLCATDTRDQVVVCGRRSDRYRLPLPVERDDTATIHRQATGMAALTSPAPCGLFEGQRRCGKAEASAYGYGDGRDPLTVFGKLASAAVGGND